MELKLGQTLLSGKDATEVGNALYLSDIPLGATIHNIEFVLVKVVLWLEAQGLMLN